MSENNSLFAGFSEKLRELQRMWRFDRAQQAIFLRALADPMKYGRNALDICEHIMQYGSQVQQEVAATIIDSLSHGKKVTDGLSEWIEPVSLSALKAAEDGGAETFILAMDVIADSLEKAAQGRASLIQKAAYPGALVAMTIAIMIYPVYPLIADLKSLIGGQPDETLDRFSSIVEFYKYWLWFVILIGFCAFLAYKRYMENAVGPMRDTIDRMSLFKGYRLSAGSKLVTTFSLLKRFGMPAAQIFEIVSNSGTRYVRYHSAIAEDNLRAGVSTEVDALDTGILDRVHISLLHLYTGSDSSVLVKALDGAANEINRQIQGRAKYVAIIVALLLGCWAFINIILIITVVVGFDPSKKM